MWILVAFTIFTSAPFLSNARHDEPLRSISSTVLLQQLQLQSVVFLGNASFGRTNQIELNNPVQSTSAAPSPTRSNGRVLYNIPFKLVNPPASFHTSFTFSTLPPSDFSLVVVPNNQDLTTRFGFSVRFSTTNNSVSIWSGSRALASAISEFDLGQDFRRTSVWIDYDSDSLRLQVKASNLSSEPQESIITLRLDSSTVFNQLMFAGFSASASSTSAKSTIYAWNFTSWSPGAGSSVAASAASHRSKSLTIAGVAVAAILVSLAAGVLIVRHLRNTTTTLLPTKRNPFSRPSDRASELQVVRRFSYRELASATNSFDLSNKLGGYSTISQCYRGVLSDCMVAVKVVSGENPSLIQENWKLITELAGLRHRNLVNLLGWCGCSSTNKSMLVYEFVPNGSLDEHLFSNNKTTSSTNTLAWSHRHKAALGLAQALQCLHSRSLVHGNVKSSNVLLDGNFTARLGDYSLKNRSFTRGEQPAPGSMIIAGTFGYVAPEAVQTGKPSREADVFAFGAVVLELVCGSRALEADELGDEENVTVLVDRVWETLRGNGGKAEVVVDSKLGTLYDVQEMEAMVSVGLACSESDPGRRPSMELVVRMLADEVGLPRIDSLVRRRSDERNGEHPEKDKQLKGETSDHHKTIEEMLAMKDFGSLGTTEQMKKI